MEKRICYAPVNHPRLGDDLAHPWKYEVPAYRVSPHVWNVGGNDDVCVYLFDTGEGLMLIDSGYHTSLYLVVDRIHRLGFDPRDIKKILLSHWHGDHVNGAAALQAMSGCEIWISKEDEICHQKFKNLENFLVTVDYEATNFYTDEPVRLGRFSIQPVLTPGHTPGSTSFRWTDTDDETGETFRCAMHGGIGIPFMRPDLLKKFGNYPEDAHNFVHDCLGAVGDWEVDIATPSHLNQGNVLENLPEDTSDYRVWIAPCYWKECLHNRAKGVMEYYPEVYKDEN